MESLGSHFTPPLVVPLSHKLVATYCKIGREAYADHYLHLWPNRDPEPYFSRHLTPAAVRQDLNDVNLRHYLLRYQDKYIGILKLVIDAELKPYNGAKALLIEKIYILKAFTGLGLGTSVINKVVLLARELNKEIIWLDTMQKGPALSFYLQNNFELAGEVLLDIPEVLPHEKDMYILVKNLNQ